MCAQDRRPRILVVSDEDDQRQAIQRFLSRSGYDALVASDPTRALEIVHSGTLDTVISGLRHAGLSAPEFVARIRQSQPTVPVIVLARFEDVHLAVGCLKVGAFDYVLTPIDFEELEIALRDASGRARVEQARSDLHVERDELRARIRLLEEAVLELLDRLLWVTEPGGREPREAFVGFLDRLAEAAHVGDRDRRTLTLEALLDAKGPDANVDADLEGLLRRGMDVGAKHREGVHGDLGSGGTARDLAERVYRVAKVIQENGGGAAGIRAARQSATGSLDAELVTLAETIINRTEP